MLPSWHQGLQQPIHSYSPAICPILQGQQALALMLQPLLLINHHVLPLYFESACIFLVASQIRLGAWNSPCQPAPCLAATASCCQGTRQHLGRRAGLQVLPAVLTLCALHWGKEAKKPGTLGQESSPHTSQYPPVCRASSSDSSVQSVSPGASGRQENCCYTSA